MYKSNLLKMLDNEHILSGEREVLIEVAGDILQAESSTCQTMLHLFNPNVIRSKDLINLVASRYDSEAFINLSQRYATSEDTANKLVQIHRRRASENILEYLSREFFDGNRVRMEFNKETMEMIIRVYVEDLDTAFQNKLEDVFDKVQNRLLVAGIKKSIRVSLLLSDTVMAPRELYIMTPDYYDIGSPTLSEKYNYPILMIVENMKNPIVDLHSYMPEWDFIDYLINPYERYKLYHPLGRELGRFKLNINKLSYGLDSSNRPPKRGVIDSYIPPKDSLDNAISVLDECACIEVVDKIGRVTTVVLDNVKDPKDVVVKRTDSYIENMQSPVIEEVRRGPESPVVPEEGFTTLIAVGKEVGKFRLGMNRFSKEYTKHII